MWNGRCLDAEGASYFSDLEFLDIVVCVCVIPHFDAAGMQ